MTALWLIILCGVLAIVYAVWAIRSVLAADPGNPRMQEIAAAVREGAQAYLKRQYTTIGIVGVVIFFVLAYFLGICPFLGVSGKLSTATRMGGAVTFVMLVTAASAWAVNLLLEWAGLTYLRLICYIVIIAATVQFVEMLVKKLSRALFRALGIFLPLITTNCTILGLALFQTNRGYDLPQCLVFALAVDPHEVRRDLAHERGGCERAVHVGAAPAGGGQHAAYHQLAARLARPQAPVARPGPEHLHGFRDA